MIEWHRVSDELPPDDTFVLVSAVSIYGQYPEAFVGMAKLEKRDWAERDDRNIWRFMWDNTLTFIKDDDQWAYLNLPKPEKDGGSD